MDVRLINITRYQTSTMGDRLVTFIHFLGVFHDHPDRCIH